MVSEPGLPSLAFAPNPVRHEQAIAGVAIPLHYLGVHVLATVAESGVRIGGDSFGPQVKLGRTRKMGQVKTGPNGGVARPATIRASAALAHTTSKTGPGAPAKNPRTTSTLWDVSPPRRADAS